MLAVAIRIVFLPLSEDLAAIMQIHTTFSICLLFERITYDSQAGGTPMIHHQTYFYEICTGDSSGLGAWDVVVGAPVLVLDG